MAIYRDVPYGAFNYTVALGGDQGAGEEGVVIGGFSDVSGLGCEVNYSDYRNGNDMTNTMKHVQNIFKNDEVILKRGLCGSTLLFDWIKAVRDGKRDVRQSVIITLLNEAREAVATFKLTNVQCKKWVGGPLAAKGGGEVAMEELHLVHEGIEYQ